MLLSYLGNRLPGKNESEAPNPTSENQPQASENNAPKQQEAPQQPQVPEVKQQNQQTSQKQGFIVSCSCIKIELGPKEQKRSSESNPPQPPKPATISYAQKLQQNLNQQQAKPYQPQDFPPVQSHAQSQNQPQQSHEPQQHQPATPSQPQPQPSQPSQSQPQQPLPQTSASARYAIFPINSFPLYIFYFFSHISVARRKPLLQQTILHHQLPNNKHGQHITLQVFFFVTSS